MNDWNAFDIKHLPEISYKIKKQRKGFGNDLEKIWRYKTEQPKIGKDLRMHFSKGRNNFNAVRL